MKLNRRLTLLVAGVAVAGLAAPLATARQAQPAPAVAAARNAKAPQTDAVLRNYISSGKMPGIVVAFGRGDTPPIVVAEGAIAAEPGAPRADGDSLWRVYSMTKPVTAMAAMILIEEGKLKLDQPIADFIPGFKNMKVLVDPEKSLESRPAARQITVRHLLTHTAGLGYSIITKGPLLDEYLKQGINPAAVNAPLEVEARKTRPATLAAFADKVATLPLIADPGTKWSYSISLDVLGRVIEVASGIPFDTFLETRIFKPLKMNSTGFTVPAGAGGRLATNYAYSGETRVPIDPAATSAWLTPPTFPYGGAGLVSSANDYDRFLHMLLNEGELDGVRIMKPETVRLAMSNLLPEGVTFGGVSAATGGPSAGPKMGFGAGGSVYLEDGVGASKGTYGWGGAAGTVAWVDPQHKVRGNIMVNYFPGERIPLRAEVIPAIYADLLAAAPK